MYVNPCATHFFRDRFEGKNRGQLEAERKLLRDSLDGLEEERAELAAMPGPEVARLRVQIEQDGQMMRAKLAALESVLADMDVGEGPSR